MDAQIYHLSWTVSKRDARDTIRSVWIVTKEGNLRQIKIDCVSTPLEKFLNIGSELLAIGPGRR